MGWEKSTEGKVLVLEHQGVFSPPFKLFRPIQLGWKQSPSNLWVDRVCVSLYMGWGEAFGHVMFDSFTW